jgi:hypothetical protein
VILIIRRWIEPGARNDSGSPEERTVTPGNTTSILVALVVVASAHGASAQPATPPAAAAQAAAANHPGGDDPDLDVNPAQPDFDLAALPTTARLPRSKMVFRLTHRFNEPVSDAGLGGLFGFDSGAMVGIEFRIGLAPGWQAVFYRTSDRTIQFSTQFDVARQRGRWPIGIAAIAGVEGADNFQERYSPSLGLVLSREVGTRGAAYVEPVWVNNSNPLPRQQVDANSTMLVGLGTRLRVLDTTYVVAEVVPRAGGFGPGVAQISFGIEKRAGGHVFQLTVANGLGTTWGQMARGGPEGNHWYLGFNLTRKFY